MLFIVIIFFISIVVAFTMLTFKSWQIKTARIPKPEDDEKLILDLSFRHVEKNMLYLTKHIVQNIVVTIVKYWFIVVTKIKKIVLERWPKIHDRFKKKQGEELPSLEKSSFLRKAKLELRSKIRRTKEKVRRENE